MIDFPSLPLLDDDLVSTAIMLAYVPAFGATPEALYRVDASALIAGNLPIKNLPDDTYELILGDNRKYLRATNVDGCLITIPATADVPFTEGTLITVRAATDQPVGFVGAAGVTLNPPGGPAFTTTFAEEGATVQALLVDAAGDEWDIIGDTATGV